jgi:hypothetical protein
MHVSRFENIMHLAAIELDTHDLWGSALGMFFDIAAVLDMSDVDGSVTPAPFARWDYHRGYGSIPDIHALADRFATDYSEGEFADDYGYSVMALAAAYVDGLVSQADLIYAGDVLDRYTRVLRSAGKDY